MPPNGKTPSSTRNSSSTRYSHQNQKQGKHDLIALPYGIGVPMYNHDGSVMTDQHGQTVYRSQYLATHPLRTDCEERVGSSGKKFVCVSGGGMIRTLNSCFGNGGWGTEITRERVVHSEKDSSGRWVIGYVATVRLTLGNGMSYEDCGCGEGINDNATLAHEKAMKYAVTDATKRAARHIGERLGNALYGKEESIHDSPLDNTEALEDLVRREHEISVGKLSKGRLPKEQKQQQQQPPAPVIAAPIPAVVHATDPQPETTSSHSPSDDTCNVSLSSSTTALNKLKGISKLLKPQIKKKPQSNPQEKDQQHEQEQKTETQIKRSKRQCIEPKIDTAQTQAQQPTHTEKNSRRAAAVFTFSPHKIQRSYQNSSRRRTSKDEQDWDGSSIVSCPSRAESVDDGDDNESSDDSDKVKNHVRHRYRTVFVNSQPATTTSANPSQVPPSTTGAGATSSQIANGDKQQENLRNDESVSDKENDKSAAVKAYTGGAQLKSFIQKQQQQQPATEQGKSEEEIPINIPERVEKWNQSLRQQQDATTPLQMNTIFTNTSNIGENTQALAPPSTSNRQEVQKAGAEKQQQAQQEQLVKNQDLISQAAANLVLTPSSSLMVEDIKSMRSRIHRYRSLCVGNGATGASNAGGGTGTASVAPTPSGSQQQQDGNGGVITPGGSVSSGFTPRTNYSFSRIGNNARE